MLVAGGSGASAGTGLSTAELYDPSSNAWSSAGNLATGRERNAANLLPNGKVLVTGGSSAGASGSAELYDPSTKTWSSAGNLATTRGRHTATLLPDGKVLVAGIGVDFAPLSRAELYDPSSNTWSTLPSVPSV